MLIKKRITCKQTVVHETFETGSSGTAGSTVWSMNVACKLAEACRILTAIPSNDCRVIHSNHYYICFVHGFIGEEATNRCAIAI